MICQFQQKFVGSPCATSAVNPQGRASHRQLRKAACPSWHVQRYFGRYFISPDMAAVTQGPDIRNPTSKPTGVLGDMPRLQRHAGVEHLAQSHNNTILLRNYKHAFRET